MILYFSHYFYEYDQEKKKITYRTALSLFLSVCIELHIVRERKKKKIMLQMNNYTKLLTI